MTTAPASEINRAVHDFRGFNRFYTRFLGLLDEELIKSGFSLAEARVLFELATRSESGATEIANDLSLDPGYLSRILRKLEEAGLLDRSPSLTDARFALLRLTRKGKNVFAELNRRSSAQAKEILDKLTPSHRSLLIRSMNEVKGVLAQDHADATAFVLRPHRPGDMGWVVQRQTLLYVGEYGWNGDYESLASRIVADFIDRFDPVRERCWIAERLGEPLGCIFLVRHPEREGVAKLRLLHVEHAARGMGLGKALVAECLQFARVAGYKTVTLWTQSILHAAHKIYQEAGFRLVLEEPHHSFGKDLIGQTWELDL
ncbi:MAG TPA: helix-turn-helix domain-containing GNAT family N-acetyltransferase [Terracidiphilus sp.]|jgi:DNA-binding MarR family transcriptional regulator/GNAT superfamily N-acetyltransferase|nr:helix-turn-helix domain-containing GNAT family N-acetyltransferase [Terracidiphilus sp.]